MDGRIIVNAMTYPRRSIDMDYYSMNPDIFPETVACLIDIIGMSAICRLVTVFGGESFHIPKILPDNHPLVEFMGIETARKIASIYSGERLYIPKCARLLEQHRNIMIVSDYRQGMDYEALADKWRLSQRQIINILRRGK